MYLRVILMNFWRLIVGIITEVTIHEGRGSSARSGCAGSEQSATSSRRDTARAEAESADNPTALRQRRGKQSNDLLLAFAQTLGEEQEEGQPGGTLFKRQLVHDLPAAQKEHLLRTKEPRICCGLMTWVKHKDLPDLPLHNMFGMTMKSAVRRQAVKIAVNQRMENFWLFLAVLHALVALPEVQDNVFGCTLLQNQEGKFKLCTYSLPDWHHLFFLLFFCAEAAIKITGLGLAGGQLAWWTTDFYNKLDIIALLAYIYETAAQMVFKSSSQFSLRGLRLMKLLKPLGQIGVFSDLETIFHTFSHSIKPMATVLLFIWFVLILFGIMGMAIYGDSSFRRRCVWADTLEIKAPEQFCKRIEEYHEYPHCTATFNPTTLFEKQYGTKCEVNPQKRSERTSSTSSSQLHPSSLHNNCGPFQLCLDVANPNFGFTSFDHLPAALITLFQVMSGDSDVNVMWHAIQSEPSTRVMTEIFFLVYVFLVIHVLINVFVAVFANIFAESRSAHEEMIEMRRKGMTRLSISTSSSTSSSEHSRRATSISGSSGSSSSGHENEIVVPSKDIDNEDEVTRQYRLRRIAQQQAEEAEMKRKVATPDWIQKNLNRQVDPAIQHHLLLFARDNDLYDRLTFTITLAQSVSLSLIGEMGPNTDNILEDVISNANIFFIFDAIAQIICDGSLGQHFKSGENIFNCWVTFLTTLGLVLRLLGLSPDATAVLRGAAIFRLLRMCKFSFLKVQRHIPCTCVTLLSHICFMLRSCVWHDSCGTTHSHVVHNSFTCGTRFEAQSRQPTRTVFPCFYVVEESLNLICFTTLNNNKINKFFQDPDITYVWICLSDKLNFFLHFLPDSLFG